MEYRQHLEQNLRIFSLQSGIFIYFDGKIYANAVVLRIFLE